MRAADAHENLEGKCNVQPSIKRRGKERRGSSCDLLGKKKGCNDATHGQVENPRNGLVAKHLYNFKIFSKLAYLTKIPS